MGRPFISTTTSPPSHSDSAGTAKTCYQVSPYPMIFITGGKKTVTVPGVSLYRSHCKWDGLYQVLFVCLQVYSIAEETIVLLLEFNPESTGLLEWVVERCFTGENQVADGCFMSLATIFATRLWVMWIKLFFYEIDDDLNFYGSRTLPSWLCIAKHFLNLYREYPCDHYTAIINVTLMNTGCPRSNIHETALQLLQVNCKNLMWCNIYSIWIPLEPGSQDLSILSSFFCDFLDVWDEPPTR